VLCVRWYLRYCLTLRDLEELMRERRADATVHQFRVPRAVFCTRTYARILRQISPPNWD
jgi:transposase-like protein